jgi:threonine dehydratase
MTRKNIQMMTANLFEAATQQGDLANVEQLRPEIITKMAEEAVVRTAELAYVTPIVEADCLDGVLLKAEYRSPGGSFKRRGAGNAAAAYQVLGYDHLFVATRGNHGIGAAEAGQHYGMRVTAAMPESVSSEKKRLIRGYGAEVVECPGGLEATVNQGLRLCEEAGGRFVHPYANSLVIAGQATMGLELLDQVPDMTHLVLPVGGSGLYVGVASVIRERLKNRGVTLVAAQVAGCDAFVRSLKSGKPEQLEHVDSRFEGVAVGTTHPLMLEAAKPLVDRTIVVQPDEVYKTLYDFRRETGELWEPAGGVAATAARKLIAELCDATAQVVAVASGANPTAALPGYLDARARRFEWPS